MLLYKRDGRGPVEILKLPIWMSNTKARPSDLSKKEAILRKYKKLGRHIDGVSQYYTCMKYRISNELREKRETIGILFSFLGF
jgi:hypothetical protein